MPNQSTVQVNREIEPDSPTTIAELRALLVQRGGTTPAQREVLIVTRIVDPVRVEAHNALGLDLCPGWFSPRSWFVEQGHTLILSQEVVA